jgi:4-hydroxyphenylpyruvate dioxygenase-like putative hemolysin
MYPPGTRSPRPFEHPNSAQRIAAVWIVVKDVRTASFDLKALGWRAVGAVRSRSLGATGREFATDNSSIMLLQPNGTGPAAEFRRQRGEGVMGVSVAVTDLARAHLLVETNTGRKFPEYDGFHGKSFLVPADLASGCWIEFTQE